MIVANYCLVEYFNTQERSSILRKVNDVMLANKQDLGQIISLETVSK